MTRFPIAARRLTLVGTRLGARLHTLLRGIRQWPARAACTQPHGLLECRPRRLLPEPAYNGDIDSIEACLWGSAIMLGLCLTLTFLLPVARSVQVPA
jgi:hypothetical protein